MGDDDGMLLNLAGMDAGPPRAQKKRTGPSNNNGRNGRRPSGSDGGQLQQQQQPARQKQRPQAGDDGEGAGGRDHRRSSGGGTGGGGGGGGGGRAQWDGDDDDFDGFDGAGGRRQPEQKRRAPRLVVEDSSTLPALKAPKVSAAGRAGLFGHGAGSADAATAAAAAAAAAAASNAVPGSFESLGVPEKLAEHLRANMALEWPTRVQALTIPVMLSGRDALVRSETGSGKTLAYLLPIACSLSAAEPRVTRADGTLALVLSPTRELCLQTLDVASKLVRPVIWLVPGAVMGGESRQKEKSRIRKGITILCATPGRLVDHVRSTQSFRLASVRFVVFDEADRLLDMGFEEHITEILQHLKSAAAEAGESGRRCTALLSATLPPTLARLTEVALKDPVRIVASRDGQVAAGNTVPRSTRWAAENDEDKDGDGDGDSDGDGDGDTGGRGGRAGPSGGEDAEPEGFAFPQQLRQEFLVVPCKARAAVLLAALRDLLRKGTQRVLCFFSTCESSEFHFRLFSVLLLEGQPALPCDLHRLHGDLTQPERQKVFKLFNGGKAGVLFCTDVAARGLDFSAVGACLQVDLAGPGDYCHRVGRTARMGHEVRGASGHRSSCPALCCAAARFSLTCVCAHSSVRIILSPQRP